MPTTKLKNGQLPDTISSKTVDNTNDINTTTTRLKITGGSNGQVLSTDGSGNLSWTTAGGGGSSTPTQVDVINTSGTWDKPTGAKTITVYCIGGGAGGGAGRSNATSSVRCGGAGGGAGGISAWTFRAADVPNQVNVTIGAGGTGAATVTNANGGNGNNGGTTIFGSLLQALGGFGGAGGTTASASTGGAGGYVMGQIFSFAGLTANITARTGAGGNGSGSTVDGSAGGEVFGLGSTGGGGGAGNAANNLAVYTGGRGGKVLDSFKTTESNGGIGGINQAGNYDGVAGSNFSYGSVVFGLGGGGGVSGGNASRNGGNGGNGGVPGGGGGGGGSSIQAFPSGKGGDGGNGGIYIFTEF